MLFGGDEFWFFGPRVFPGDTLRMERMLYDYKVANTTFAGPTMFSRGDTTYFNQHGEPIARQRSTSIRYLAENAVRLGSFDAQREEPVWTEEELEAVEREKIEYIQTHLDLAHGKRLWDSVNVGDQLPKRALGPHSIQTLTTESRTDVGGWGAHYQSDGPSSTMEAGWIPEMTRDEEGMRINPGLGDGLGYGPSRGHVQPKYARLIGMPRGYGYAPPWAPGSPITWRTGRGVGMVLHVNSQYRNPAFTGDVTYQMGEVENKFVDDRAGTLRRCDT
jgi:hypothetical protein